MGAIARQQGLVAFLRSNGVAFRGSDKIFLAPDIPLKKLSGAAVTVSMWVRPDEIAVLVDDTAFGGAKEGIFFTDTWMITKAFMEEPSPIQLTKIDHLAVEGRKVYINYSEAISLTFPEKHELAALVDAVNVYIQALKTSSPASVRRDSAPLAATPSATRASVNTASAAGACSTAWFEQHIAELQSERLWGDDLAYRQLLLEILRLAGSLPQFCRDQGITLTDSQWAIVCGDGMRLEVYFYLFTVVQTLLISTCGFTDEEAQDFLVGMIISVMIPYAENVEVNMTKRGLRAAANPASMLEDSKILTQFKDRTQRYRWITDNDIQELPMAFMACLSSPAVAHLVLDPDELNEITGETRNLIRRVIRRPSIFDFMRDISSGVEIAMTIFFDKINS